MADTRPVLVATGLTSGIGHALSELLGGTWRIVGVSRNPPAEYGDAGDWIQTDLSVPDLAAAAVTEALHSRKIARVQGLVHLGGVVFSDQAVATTGYEWEYTIAVNLRSAFELTTALKPVLVSGASIVLVSSVDAKMSSTAGPAAAYGAAKAGLNGLMRHLAAEWGRDGIRVNAVVLGALGEGMGVKHPATEAELLPHIALGRLGTARDAAQAIRFLLDSEASSYITGTEMVVDGGLNISY